MSTLESVPSPSVAAPPPAPPVILDAYVRSAPSNRNAVELFAGEWASKFPPPFNDLPAGGVPLFQDSRFAWALNQLGGVHGQKVLELGPLEGGHTYMLERAGAASIVSIEANSRAYLKCLITKEIFNFRRVRYLCGDFVPYLEGTTEQFDFILSAGVLYHMKDPINLLRLISLHTSRTYLWTHYYDEAVIRANGQLSVKFPSETVTDFNGRSITLHRQEYQESLQAKNYCGGSSEFSHWLTRADLLEVLRQLGFDEVHIEHEKPDHPHGPCLSVVAIKSSDRGMRRRLQRRLQSWTRSLSA